MKRNILFLACCIGLMLFASCKKQVAPTLTLMQGEGYLTENSEVYIHEQTKLGFTATGQKLTHFDVTITQNGEIVSSYPLAINEVDTYTDSITVSIDIVGPVTVTCTVTDAKEQTASKSFNVTCVETPNMKFLGHYEGNALGTGTLIANITGMEPINQEFTDSEVPVILDLEETQGRNEIYGHCIIDGRTLSCAGIVDGDVVTFGAIDDVVTFDYDLGGIQVSPQMNVTYSIHGTLSNGKLMLDGTCLGNGVINLMFIYNGTVDLEANVGGSLDKMR